MANLTPAHGQRSPKWQIWHPPMDDGILHGEFYTPPPPIEYEVLKSEYYKNDIRQWIKGHLMANIKPAHGRRGP